MHTMSDERPKTIILGNRKIDREDYNIYLQGILHAFGSGKGNITKHIGHALRHYGVHLLQDDTEHIEHINKLSQRSTRQNHQAPIFTPEMKSVVKSK